MQNYENLKVDLSNCDKEPIHLIGRIQPHGFLLVIHPHTWIIEQVSENTNQFLQKAPKDLLNTSLQDLLSRKAIAIFKQEVLRQEESNPFLLSIKGRSFFAFTHQVEGKLLLECEPFSKITPHSILLSHALLADLQVQLNKEQTLEQMSALVAHFIQSILDYDRVIIFQFDQDYHAKVIAEVIKPDIHSFLGHHFPQSDIPLPARALLEKKRIRHIPDVAATSVAIIPYRNPTTDTPINILPSELRNPSEIHLEYLTNMQVRASLSFSILVKGKLWGLISCSHQDATYIDVWKRQLGDILAKTFANVIPTSEQKRDYKQLDHYKQLEELIMEEIYTKGNIKEVFYSQQESLLGMSESSGAALFVEGELILVGSTPNESEILEIREWLIASDTPFPYYTQELSKCLDRALAYREVASGLLALEISKYAKEYLLLFKPEIKATRIWAGNPQKLSLGEDMRLHPRKSFEKWEEQIRGRSLPWRVNVRQITEQLLKDLISFRISHQAGKLEELNTQLQAKAAELTLQNEELEEFAAILTHDLRSPLNSITGLYELYQREPSTEKAIFVMDHIKMVSDNMRSTIADLHLILKTRIDHQTPREKVRIEEIIAKEKQNLETLIVEKEADISLDLQVDSLILPKIYMESIIHNFLSNALKYASPKRKPSIQVKSYTLQKQVYLSFSDNGLGIDLTKAGNKLFGLYKTFHEHKDSKGLGLYLAKMQVESLGGRIEVESQPDQGTTFIIIFNNVII